MKKLIAAALAAVFCTLTLSACSSANGAVSSAAPAAPSSSAPSSSQPVPSSSQPATEKPKLIIGLDDQFPPMGFRDDKNNLVGFDIDLAVEVANRLGMEAVPTPIDWSTKELEVNNGKVDVLWNGLTITDARKESMLMSGAYIKNAQVIVVAKDSTINTVEDLAGKVVALQEGSSAQGAYAACAANGKEKELIAAPENITLFQDLKIGRIDAVIIDKVFAEYYITENGEGKLRELEVTLDDEEYGFAFKKGNTELAEKVFAAMQDMVNDGTAAKISEKWFGENRVIFSYTK